MGAARAAAIKPWTLSWGNNSNSIILTGATTERRNCWKWLGKQQPRSGRRRRSWYWMFSLTSSQTWPWDVAHGLSSSPVSVQFFQSLSQKEGWDVILKSWGHDRGLSGRKFCYHLVDPATDSLQHRQEELLLGDDLKCYLLYVPSVCWKEVPSDREITPELSCHL